jgi:hypothetical protein
MALTPEECRKIEGDLNRLFEAVPSKEIGSHDQIRQYIDVGEYGLALDDLADVYLGDRQSLTPSLRSLFDGLANKMGMKSGDQWQAVAEILASDS